jgi:hypothetical protein
MIDSDTLPTFSDEGIPTHWIAPARDHQGFQPIDDKDRYTQQAVKEHRKQWNIICRAK